MALAHGVVVVVVRGRDLHDTGAELAVHVGVGDHGDLAVAQRQLHRLADEGGVALVLGVHRDGGVAEHGLGAGGGHHHVAAAVAQGVADVPEEAVLFFALHFQVAHRRFEHRVPVDQALAAVDQAFFVQAHEGFGDHGRELVVHGEVLARPVHGVAHAAHLRGDGVAAHFLPLPDLLREGLAAEVVAADLLFLQLALDHDLRGDAGVVGAGHPEGVRAHHAVVAREAVHDGLVERVAHVQGAGHVRRRELDAERGRAGLRFARTAKARLADTALLPPGAPAGFDGSGFEGLGEGGQAGLLHGVGHGGANNGNGIPWDAAGWDGGSWHSKFLRRGSARRRSGCPAPRMSSGRLRRPPPLFRCAGHPDHRRAHWRAAWMHSARTAASPTWLASSRIRRALKACCCSGERFTCASSSCS